MDGKIDVNITFDENNQIRVLSADKFRETENLKGECIDFLKKIMNFNEMVSTLIDVLDTQAQKIEDAKLKVCSMTPFNMYYVGGWGKKQNRG